MNRRVWSVIRTSVEILSSSSNTITTAGSRAADTLYSSTAVHQNDCRSPYHPDYLFVNDSKTTTTETLPTLKDDFFQTTKQQFVAAMAAALCLFRVIICGVAISQRHGCAACRPRVRRRSAACPPHVRGAVTQSVVTN